MTNEEIQKHIEQNCRHVDGSPAMDEQSFYEGAKWMRDQALSLHNVVGRSEQLPTKNDFISELEQHQEKWKTAHSKKVNNAYALGFRHCFNFINDRVKLK